MRRDDLYLLGAVVIGLALLERFTSFKSEVRTSLPKGARMPGQGEMREVPALRTSLDVTGFPALFNAALQIVESPSFAITSFLAPRLETDPIVTMPDADPDYRQPAEMFAAMAALESNNGVAVYHYNVGNVTTRAGDYYLNPPSDTAHRYQVFLYPLQGAVAMVDRVKRLWPAAYRAAYSGAVGPFAVGLKQGMRAYYEADTGTYAAGIRARAKQLGYTTLG